MGRIGLFHQLPQQTGGLVVGRQVAVGSFVEALAQHTVRHQYDLFCPGPQQEPIQSGLAALFSATSAQPPVGVHDQRVLLQQLDHFGFAAWHDTQFDTYRPFALRSRAARAFPISMVHHTLSYPHLLHDNFLRLLLSRPHPYDSIVCTSTAAREVIVRLLEHVGTSFNRQYGTELAYQGRLDVIPLGVDTARFKPRNKVTMRAKFDLPEDAFILLWIGRLSAIDKADLIPWVQVFGELVRENPDKKLVLVCAGAEHRAERFGDFIQSYAAALHLGDRVRVQPVQPHEAHLLHAAADIFVAPTDNIQETFGLTPVEAMACGVPAVVSDWNGYRDTVRDAETGFLIPTRWTPAAADIVEGAFLGDAPFDHFALAQSVVVDMRAFKQAVQALIQEEELRRQLGANARKHAEAQCSWAVVIKAYEALWDELSVQCQATEASVGSSAHYAEPVYGKAFQHYASETIADAFAVALAPLGRQFVAQKAHMPLHPHAGKTIDASVLQRIMKGVVYAETHQQEMTIGRLVDVIAKNMTQPHARDMVRRHVFWLLKYAYLQSATEERQATSIGVAQEPASAPPLAPPTKQRTKVFYFVSSYISHQVTAEAYLQCLHRIDLEVTHSMAYADEAALQQALADADLVILHNEMVTFPQYYEQYPVLTDKYVIGYTMWDTVALPEKYQKALQLVDEVWTCSSFSAEILRRYVDDVYVIPHVVTKPDVPPEVVQRMKQRLAYDESCFYFYTIGNAINPRKNLLASLYAFNQCFSALDGDCKFIVKSIQLTLPGLSQMPNVVLLEDWLEAEEIAALHSLGDCFVNAHCAEGWGLGMSEAMAMGNLVVATGYSGNMEFMNAENALLVDYQVEQIRSEDLRFLRTFQPELSGDMEWAYIDLDSLMAQMRYAYEHKNHQERLEKARQVAQTFSHERVAALIAERITVLIGSGGV